MNSYSLNGDKKKLLEYTLVQISKVDKINKTSIHTYSTLFNLK